MELDQIVLQSAACGLTLQRSDGSIPAGHNGPWNDPETPVRNTGHWAIIFSKAYELTGENEYLQAVEDAATFLSDPTQRPNGYTVKHRTAHDKDHANGLIGQAWTIETLCHITDVLNDSSYRELAEEIFQIHPFIQDLGLWKSVEVTGEDLGVDTTFNHQLWFAMAGSLIGSDAVDEKVRRFLDEIPHNLTLYDQGLIFHRIDRGISMRDLPKFRNSTSREILHSEWKRAGHIWLRDKDPMAENETKSVGYHAFNTYALAVLKEQVPEHTVWHDECIHQLLEYSISTDYENALEGNPYGYPYNPPGIENAYTLEVFFDNASDRQQQWLDKQFRRTWNQDSGLMNDVESDPATYAARLYEATRLPNITVNVD